MFDDRFEINCLKGIGIFDIQNEHDDCMNLYLLYA